MSLGVVREAEQGGSVRVETLHILARALGTTTPPRWSRACPTPYPASSPSEESCVSA
ncbi:hypothetical protein [Streptomyces sp. NPDC056227]|uniref:hypothetical protein n=1 Tax=Streptomyces sp. NPDC056227 TaxID=3345753 RepID=UPI0035E2C586